jgi:DNA-binding NarL/FixJ family response regulator
MLRSLLVTPDENTIKILGRVFRDLEVELEHYSEPSAALASATKNRYDAIVIDNASSQTAELLNKILELPSCNKSVRIVLADSEVAMHEIFRTGTQVILYKPLSLERVRHGLRAVRNLMARDRRRGTQRIRTMIPARMNQGKSGGKQVLITDLSESGAAIKCETGDLQAVGNFNLEFAPTGETETIHAKAEVVWQDNDGGAGLRFLDMASYSRKRLAQWLKEQAAHKKFPLAALAARSGS